MKLRTLFTLCVGVLLALNAGRALWLVRSFSAQLTENQRRIVREEAIDAAVTRVAGIAVDLETGVRSFQLTGDPSLRAPYEEASAARDGELQRLVQLLGEATGEGAIAERLRGRLVAWDSAIAAPLLRRSDSAGEEGDRRALTLQGKQRMDEIRGDLAQIHGGVAARRMVAAGAFVDYQRDLLRGALLIVVAMFAVLLGMWALIARGIERPLAKLVVHAHRIARGELATIEVRGVTEVRSLAAAWNVMLERLAGERERERRFAAQAARNVTEEQRLRDTLAGANRALLSRNEELTAQEEALRAKSAQLAENKTELTLRNEELARASRLKSDFLASMSHELRTPLNAVIGFSDLLLSSDYGPLTPRQRPAVVDVLAAGQQLLTLINDVLDLSKIEADRVEVCCASVDVAGPVSQAFNLMAGDARAHAITLVNHVSPGGPLACADPDRLRQVVINLVSNAVKFTHDGGTVTITAEETAGRMRVAVADTGIGIAPSDAPKLFSAFSQLDTGNARRFKGTGLGLSISKKLVELMGGEIGFTSALGEGSTFFFTLPLARTSTPQGVPPRRSSAPPGPQPRRSGSRPTVLLVDHEEGHAQLVEGGLRREGYVVARARSADQALAMIDEVKPGLFVLDLGLPDLSSFELIERIRAMAAHERTPIAVLSARDLGSEDKARLAAWVQLVAHRSESSQGGFFELLARLSVSRVRVLLVDDSEMNRKVIRAMLQRLPCDVIEATDAASGLAAARKHLPDVILMDIEMPGMDGLTATAELKADPLTKSIPVITVTAHAMTGDAERAFEAGCVAHVTKPIARVKLKEALDLALGAGWSEAPSTPGAE